MPGAVQSYAWTRVFSVREEQQGEEFLGVMRDMALRAIGEEMLRYTLTHGPCLITPPREEVRDDIALLGRRFSMRVDVLALREANDDDWRRMALEVAGS